MERCCICLEEPKEEEPLHLIACGCNGAWFHEICEKYWIFSVNILRCPVCRRDVPVQYVYDFYDKNIYITLAFLCLEVPLGIYFDTFLLMAQAVFMLAFPFLFPCSVDLSFFIVNYNLHAALDILFLSRGIYTEIQRELIFFRFIHIIMFSTTINKRTHIPVLSSFTLGRDIVHSATKKSDLLVKPSID